MTQKRKKQYKNALYFMSVQNYGIWHDACLTEKPKKIVCRKENVNVYLLKKEIHAKDFESH